MLIPLLLALLAGPAPAAAFQDPAGVLFMTRNEGEAPKDAVLLARPLPDKPAQYEFFDANRNALAAVADPESPGRSVLRLVPVTGRSFATEGTSTVVWTHDGTKLRLEKPEIELALRAEKHVLVDDEVRDVPIAGTAPVPAPQEPAGQSLLGKLKSLRGATAGEGVRDTLRAALDNPETLDRALQSLLSANRGLALLEDLTLDLKMLDTKGGEETLGVAYSWKRSFNPDDWTVGDDGSVSGFEYSFSTEGNIAFEADANPQDFLRSQLSATLFQSTGGVVRMSPDEARQFATEFNKLGDELVATKDARNSDVARAIMRKYQSACSTQFYWEGGLDAGLESNQEFTELHYTVGAHVGANINAGRPDSLWSRANLVDYPAALLRVLTGYDEKFTPRGNALPWLIVMLDHVTTDGQGPRALAGDTSDFVRVGFEAAYRAPIATFDRVDWYLGVSWRAYQEIDATQAVRDADADRSSRFVVTVSSAKGLFASYATGKLPFDLQNQDTFELGWSINF